MPPFRHSNIEFSHAQPLNAGECNVLAEAGQCMEGSVGRAIQLVRDAAWAGAWGIKTQLLKPDRIATASAAKYWDDKIASTTQREAFTAAGLVDYQQWGPVRAAAKECGIAFVATPFDLDAIEALEAIDVDAYKIASGDLLFSPLVEAVCDTGRPVFLSTGAAWADEIESVVGRLLDRDPSLRYRLVLLGCSLIYPTPIEEANLGRIGRLREMVIERNWSPVKVGYSDHTLGFGAAFGIGAAGAILLEKHFTYQGAEGPVADHGMAVDKNGLKKVVDAARLGRELCGVSNLIPSEGEARARVGARRALWLTRDVERGQSVRSEDVEALRPCPEGSLPMDSWYQSSSLGVWDVSKSKGDFVAQCDVDFGGSPRENPRETFPRWR